VQFEPPSFAKRVWRKKLIMHSLFDSTIQFLINFINEVGYLGIFIGMFLESTIVPIPSELVMIPAGISAAAGGMNIYIATLVGILGNVAGAIFSYYLALLVGRKILLRIGKYFFIKKETILKIEEFFKKHGAISVFIGRLLIGFRHFISLPAGIAKMDIRLFTIYTTLGSTIWTSVLSGLGFFIGENQELIKNNLHEIAGGTALFCLMVLVGYVIYKGKKKPKSSASDSYKS
jgi:membrane protein DedA with SNARE-associated domain